MEQLGGMDVIRSARPSTPRMEIPSTADKRRDVKMSHSTDDPHGALYEGRNQLDEFSAYYHLNAEMLGAMMDNQRRERDFRHSQIHVMRQMGADLAEDNRRLSGLEGAFEIGRETLGDANI